jgi:two-component system, NtrC family, sensor histidine kinase HydH
MTIRQSLLLAFLLFSVVFATSMTALAYNRARSALSAEIRQTLATQAATLTEQIQATLFERINDLQGWRRLDLMEELKVGDVDKRLSRFLSDIKVAYAGVYRDILCTIDAQVVAASNAALIGQLIQEPPTWLKFELADGPVMLARPDPTKSAPQLIMSSELPDAFSDRNLGQIVAYFNWDEIVELLNRVTNNSARHALLLDSEQRILAFSDGLRTQVNGTHVSLKNWPLDNNVDGVFDVVDSTLGLGSLLVGQVRASRYRGLPDLGWSVVVMTPVQTAFASIHDLLYTLIALLIGSVLIAALLATKLSARMARPIQELTAYTRDVGERIDTSPRLIRGSREVEELSFAFNRMIDDLKQSQERLVRASKLAAVGEMAAKLAHEVRTPLGIIRSSAQLLDRQPGLDSRGHEMMNFMINECDRINELVTGLLESARPRKPQLAPYDMNAIIMHVAELVAAKLAQKNIKLEHPSDGVLLVIACDRDQMIQVLLNLLMNAIQMLSPGGRIRITTRFRDNDLELKVEDDGPGIPADRRDAILEPLVSNRPGGIGLGLSIVQEIVRMHFGVLQVGASDMGGACFTIRLPRDLMESLDVPS